MTKFELANKAARKELKKAVPILRRFMKSKKFARLLAEEGYRIDSGAVNDMARLLKKGGV